MSWPGIQDYNSIFEFADRMAGEGLSPELIQKLMHDNPWERVITSAWGG